MSFSGQALWNLMSICIRWRLDVLKFKLMLMVFYKDFCFVSYPFTNLVKCDSKEKINPEGALSRLLSQIKLRLKNSWLNYEGWCCNPRWWRNKTTSLFRQNELRLSTNRALLSLILASVFCNYMFSLVLSSEQWE